MSEPLSPGNEFLEQLTAIMAENVSNEQFGVSELAQAVGMSRSSLLRKVKKMTGGSVSQFIREHRLKKAMELLKDPSLTVSEIAFRVGFSSTSYFIKCFREHYGYPPGEAEKRDFDESEVWPPTQSHQLAAIMFTDIQGYTALMQQDEAEAIELRNRHREIFNAVTEKYQGKILQYYGDGTLSIFQSAINAVKCGIDMQLAFQAYPLIPVRIGIHTGDILIRQEDIIGDGVNVASRVESLGVAGSVFISAKVYDEVKNQSGIQTISMGSFEFKNVTKPLEVFAIANPGLVVPQADQLTGKLKSKDKTDRTESTLFKWKGMLAGIALMATVLIAGYFFLRSEAFERFSGPRTTVDQSYPEKSIAVLPFINDSNDSTNVYIINGLMESILNHLSKIDDLRVISRTSVEKYRQTNKIIPEIAGELGVQYFVEGSGQKIGDQIQLTIQLVDARKDQHLWSEQYTRETADIFQLQREIAKKIASEVQVIITPEVAQRIDEVPTDNLQAYDAYLKARELFYQGNRAGLEQAIPYYEQAIELDPEFAQAYAGLAITYYYLDYSQTDKQYGDQINTYADKALLYDSQLPQSLIAKALFYIHRKEYAAALPHLEKAHAYNPNSALVLNLLSEFYTQYVPNTGKYLEYALKGIRLDIGSKDSSTASFIYLHVSNAFIQSGFVAEAQQYIQQSLDYNPDNLYAAYLKAFIGYVEHRDLSRTKHDLLRVLERDSTRLDVLQEVAKTCYFQRDYPEAYRYYQKYLSVKEAMNLDMYPAQDLNIAMVLRKLNKREEAEKYLRQYSEFVASDQSIYQDLNRAMLAAYRGDTEQAIRQLEAFAEEEDYFYWIVLFLEKDPIVDELKQLPAFRQVMRKIEQKFWDRHGQIKANLTKQHLI